MDLETLCRKRKNMLLLNIVYFIGLLALGILAFSTGAGRLIWFPVLAATGFYLLLARPARIQYVLELREAILNRSVMRQLDNPVYNRMSGVDPKCLTEAGFINVISEKAYLSRERISGQSEGMAVELADVTFPIREHGLNRMFSGCLIHITAPGQNWPRLLIHGGDTNNCEGTICSEERKIIEKLGSFIPGSLSLSRTGSSLNVLLRGRFIGFSINPLQEVDERTLNSDPLPELKTVLALASGKGPLNR